MDLAQGQVAFQKLSTSTKICVNFNSLIPNAKREKPKRLLLRSLWYFNNFTIPPGKKDCVNEFPHKIHTGGNLNSAHMWGDLQHVPVPTCLRSSASPSSETHGLQFLNDYCRESCWLQGCPNAPPALAVPRDPHTMSVAQDPISTPQGHQPLPRWCHSRAYLQLPTALPCLAIGLLSQAHPRTHVPAWPWPLPIPSKVPCAPSCPVPGWDSEMATGW